MPHHRQACTRAPGIRASGKVMNLTFDLLTWEPF